MGVVAKLLEDYSDHPLGYDFTVFTVFGVALSLFLGFRSNACYDRWWEGRKQWGSYIIASRNYARAVNTVAPDTLEGRVLIHYVSAHAHALRNQLRGDEDALKTRDEHIIDTGELEKITKAPNPADAILSAASRTLRKLQASQVIDSIQMMTVHTHISELGSVQGACERIQNTPVPFPYALLVHRTIILYITMSPFAFVESAGWLTPLLTACIAYVFFGLDELSHRLVEPFSTNVLSLPLSAMCRTIDISTAMALDEQPLEPLLPVGTVLM